MTMNRNRDPDRAPLPPRDRRERQPRRLRGGLERKVALLRARGRAALTVRRGGASPPVTAARNASARDREDDAVERATPGVTDGADAPTGRTACRRRRRRRANSAPASAPIAATERMPPTRATVWLSPAATPARSSGAGESAAAVIGATTAGSPSAKRQMLATPHVHASARVVAGRSRSTAIPIVRRADGDRQPRAVAVGVAAEARREQDQPDARRREHEPGERRREAEELQVDGQEEQVRAERRVHHERDEVRAREAGHAQERRRHDRVARPQRPDHEAGERERGRRRGTAAPAASPCSRTSTSA